MAKWSELQELAREGQYCAIYQNHPYLLEVRAEFAEFFESHDWRIESIAPQLLHHLLELIQDKIRSRHGDSNPGPRMSLQAAVQWFQQNFSGNPVTFAQIISKCLSDESDLIVKLRNPPEPKLSELVTAAGRLEIFSIGLDKHIAELSLGVHGNRNLFNVDGDFRNVVELMKQTWSHTKTLSAKWTSSRRKQLVGLGTSLRDVPTLDDIQNLFVSIAKFTSISLRFCKSVETTEENSNMLEKIIDSLSAVQGEVVTMSLSIETHPDQVLKKEKRFKCSIRQLLGPLIGCPSPLKCALLSEEQALKLEQVPFDQLGRTFDIEHGTGNIATGKSKFKFQRLKLSSAEILSHQKYYVLVRSRIVFEGEERDVMTISLPVVINTHSSQNGPSEGTIFWYNAFSQTGIHQLETPNEVPWPEAAKALIAKFKAVTEKIISVPQIDYLASLLFGLASDYNSQSLSWAQFNVNALENRRHTFWQWFYTVMELTKSKSFAEPWKDGYVHGFIDKKQAKGMVTGEREGTFLVRFSESVLGGLTIAFTSKKGKVEHSLINETDLKYDNLCDIIMGNDELQYVNAIQLRGAPKSTTFGLYANDNAENIPTSKQKRNDNPDYPLKLRRTVRFEFSAGTGSGGQGARNITDQDDERQTSAPIQNAKDLALTPVPNGSPAFGNQQEATDADWNDIQSLIDNDS